MNLLHLARLICVGAVLALAAIPPALSTETITYIHTDAAGSPVAATDAGGNVIWREGYRPYGERTKNQTASAANRQFFHGKPYEADSGLAYFGARWYDPVVGRFKGVDPQGFAEANIHSFNRYAYGNNNPYKYKDPNGRWAEDIVLGIPSLAIGFQSLRENIHSGNWSGAAADAAGLAFDAVAVATPGVVGGAGLGIKMVRGTAEHVATQGASKIDNVIAETLASKGNLTSTTKLSADELLQAGEKFLGPGYKEIGKPGSGVFRSADETRQFRIDQGSLSGNHAPGVPHGHLEIYPPGAAKPATSNHIPFYE